MCFFILKWIKILLFYDLFKKIYISSNSDYKNLIKIYYLILGIFGKLLDRYKYIIVDVPDAFIIKFWGIKNRLYICSFCLKFA